MTPSPAPPGQGALFDAAAILQPVVAPDLASYHWLLVNISAGKDSQATLARVVEDASAAGVRDRIVTVFCDLGDDDEWPGTRELAAEHAAHYGLRHEVVRREVRRVVNQDGAPVGVRVIQTLLDYIEERGMWPSAEARYCTSGMKREPVQKLMTRLAGESRAAGLPPWRRVRILNILGLRAAESPSRASRPALARDARATTQTTRLVDTWLPIHDWTEEQVWARIRAEGTRHHPAYDAGMPRLSCRFCVLAPRSALIRAAQLDPAGARRRAELEARMGHDFKHGLPMREIIAAAEAAPAPAPVTVEGWRA